MSAPQFADAEGPRRSKKHKGERIYFAAPPTVVLGAGMPQKLEDLVRTHLDGELANHPAILRQLPAATPDANAEPKRFMKFLARHKIRAFKIRVEVTDYRRDVEDMDDQRSGKRLRVSVALRMFGETIPDRTMAFAGSGTATVKLEVGKRARPGDDRAAHRDAFSLAVADAVAESLAKLGAPSPSPTYAPGGHKKKKDKKTESATDDSR